jgi:hypothetical protein
MKLVIKNLGRLSSATIDLDTMLTVFVGRNNTSKTYVAHVIYGLYRYAREYITHYVRPSIPNALQWSTPVQLEFDIEKYLAGNFDSLSKGISDYLRGRLPSIFATAPDFFHRTELFLEWDEIDRQAIRRRALDYSAIVSFNSNESFRWESKKKAGSPVISVERLPPPSLDQTPSTTREASPEISEQSLSFLGFVISDAVSNVLLPRSGAPFVLSTERSAIQLFFRELFANRSAMVDAVLEEAKPESVSQIQARARLYPLAIRDGLRAAMQTRSSSSRQLQTRFLPLAEKVERLIGGEVKVAADNELTFVPAGTDKPLDLQLSSSSVKSLAALVHFLRTQARPGSFLLVDEPELNLHPDNQRKITRILAEIVRAGVAVLITTHSDYVLRELDHLVQLNDEQVRSLRDKFGYTESETVPSGMIGVYVFEETTARRLDVNHDGIEVETIDEEINALNRISKELYFALNAITHAKKPA